MDLALATELDDINRTFTAALKALETALRGTTPDHQELAKRRIHLARLARARLRFLADRVIPMLNAGPNPAYRGAARALEARIGTVMHASTRHIGDWGSAGIGADWPGYVAATRAMIARIEAFLAAERREVYPLLATIARAT